ncbi:MAG TPA: PIG-L deacetylase family protein [Acidimicrobiales bacterium]|nr:PIG-L deacetylase family protein [Acidimicrobiales bacterium]
MTLLEDTPARALAVYAHPDDPEVSCGGTLARWAAAGAEVRAVIACQGEKGSHDPATATAVLASERAAEAAAAADALGLAGIDLLGHPDGELDAVIDLRAELVGLIRAHRPDIVVCPDPTAVFFGDGYVSHVDHRTIGWATLDAVTPAAASPHYFPDRGAPHQVASMLLSGTLEPDTWVDIGASLDAKIAALFAHRSQLAADAEDWLGDFVRQRAAEEGRRTTVAHAEGFRHLRFVR